MVRKKKVSGEGTDQLGDDQLHTPGFTQKQFEDYFNTLHVTLSKDEVVDNNVVKDNSDPTVSKGTSTPSDTIETFDKSTIYGNSSDKTLKAPNVKKSHSNKNIILALFSVVSCIGIYFYNISNKSTSVNEGFNSEQIENIISSDNKDEEVDIISDYQNYKPNKQTHKPNKQNPKPNKQNPKPNDTENIITRGKMELIRTAEKAADVELKKGLNINLLLFLGLRFNNKYFGNPVLPVEIRDEYKTKANNKSESYIKSIIIPDLMKKYEMKLETKDNEYILTYKLPNQFNF